MPKYKHCDISFTELQDIPKFVPYPRMQNASCDKNASKKWEKRLTCAAADTDCHLLFCTDVASFSNARLPSISGDVNATVTWRTLCHCCCCCCCSDAVMRLISRFALLRCRRVAANYVATQLWLGRRLMRFSWTRRRISDSHGGVDGGKNSGYPWRGQFSHVCKIRRRQWIVGYFYDVWSWCLFVCIGSNSLSPWLVEFFYIQGGPKK